MIIGLNIHWQDTQTKAVYPGGRGPIWECTGVCTLGVQIILFVIEIDQSEMTKSHMFSIKLTNHKLMAKLPPRVKCCWQQNSCCLSFKPTLTSLCTLQILYTVGKQ